MGRSPRTLDIDTSGPIDQWLDESLPKDTPRQWLYTGDLHTPGKALTIRELSLCSRRRMDKDNTLLDWPYPKASVAILQGLKYTDCSGEEDELAVRAVAIFPDTKQLNLRGDRSEEIESERMSSDLILADFETIKPQWRDGGPLNRSMLGTSTIYPEVVKQMRQTVALVQDMGFELDVSGGKRGEGIMAEFVDPLTDEQIEKINATIDEAGLDSTMHARTVQSHDERLLEQSMEDGEIAPTLQHAGKPYAMAFGIAFTMDDQTVRAIYRDNKLVGYVWVLYDERGAGRDYSENDDRPEPIAATYGAWLDAGKAAPKTAVAALTSAVKQAINENDHEVEYEPDQLRWVRLKPLSVTGGKLVVMDPGFCQRRHMKGEATLLTWPHDSALVSVGLAMEDDDAAPSIAAFAILPDARSKLKGKTKDAGFVIGETYTGMVGDWKRVQKQWQDGGEHNESTLGGQATKKKEIPAYKAAVEVVRKAGFELDVEERKKSMSAWFPQPLTDKQIDQIDAALKKAGLDEKVNVIQSHYQHLIRLQLNNGEAVAKLTDQQDAFVYALPEIRDFGVFAFREGKMLTGYLCLANEI